MGKNKNKKIKKSNEKNNSKRNNYKILKRKSLSLISPFYFNCNSIFYYMIKKISFFEKYTKDLNEFKPNPKEIEELNNLIINNSKSDGDNERLVPIHEISANFLDNILALKPVPSLQNEINTNISKIMDEIQSKSSISIKKIIDIYRQKYNVVLSKTTVNRKLRNKLKFAYRKTVIKPIDLNKPLYIKMSFLFIKIILRAIELDLDFIYIDESHFKLKQPNFKTWLKKGDPCHIGSKINDKINFLLAVSKIINYKFTKLNTNTKLFKEFFIDTISKLDDEKKLKTLFIMDNHVSHVTKDITDLVFQNKLKILYCVPYESSFNAIELAFRYIKNIIYRNIFFNINSIKNMVKSILESSEFGKSLYKNYLETLGTYFYFIRKNIDVDLNNK